VKQLFKNNLYFFIPYIISVFLVSVILVLYNKAEIHLYINSYHTSFFDFFFKYWTHTGHGFFAVFITVLLLFFRYRWAIISAVSNILIGIVVQLLKRKVFPDYFRPKSWFKQFYESDYSLYIIEGAEPGSAFSFPSGHTATAFGIFILLSIFSKNNYCKFIFFIFALLAAYSRMYLSWHFLQDTLAGSLIGLLISLLIYMIFSCKKITKLDGSLLKKHKKSDK